MKKYILVFVYKCGTEIYQFQSEHTAEQLAEHEDEILEQLGIEDFDPGKGDWCSIHELNESEPVKEVIIQI